MIYAIKGGARSCLTLHITDDCAEFLGRGFWYFAEQSSALSVKMSVSRVSSRILFIPSIASNSFLEC